MRRVRALLAGLTMAMVLSGCAAAPFIPVIFIQQEREKYLLAEKSPVPTFPHGTRSIHSAN